MNTKSSPRKFTFTFPGLSETVSPHCNTIAAGSQDYVWGIPTSLQGQLGPVCVFSEGLQENYITALHAAGRSWFQDLRCRDPSQFSLAKLNHPCYLYLGDVNIIMLIMLIMLAGPNDLNVFQPVDAASSTQPALSDLSLKLVLFYNSKVSILKDICVGTLLGFTVMSYVWRHNFSCIRLEIYSLGAPSGRGLYVVFLDKTLYAIVVHLACKEDLNAG